MDSKYEKMFWSKHNECLKLKEQLNNFLEKGKIDRFVTVNSIGKIIYLNADKKFGRVKYGNTDYYFNTKSSNISFDKLKINEKYNIKFIPAHDKRYKTQVFIESLATRDLNIVDNKKEKRDFFPKEKEQINKINTLEINEVENTSIIRRSLIKRRNGILKEGQLIGLCNNTIGIYCYYLVEEVLDDYLRVYFLKRSQDGQNFIFKKNNKLVIPKNNKIDIYF